MVTPRSSAFGCRWFGAAIVAAMLLLPAAGNACTPSAGRCSTTKGTTKATPSSDRAQSRVCALDSRSAICSPSEESPQETITEPVAPSVESPPSRPAARPIQEAPTAEAAAAAVPAEALEEEPVAFAPQGDPAPSGILLVPRLIEVVRERFSLPVSIAAGLIVAVGSFIIFLLAARRRRRWAASAREDSARSAYDRLTASLVSTLSHELYTPLTPVKGYASMLKRRTLSTEEVHRVADEMIGASQRLEHLFDMLVTLADVERGARDIQRDVVDLPELIRHATQRIALLEHRSISVAIERGIPNVRADAQWLELAVTALVDNAVKFSPEGGTVRVDVQESGRASKLLQIRVGDDGIGMTPEQLRVAFDPFRQVDGTLTRQFGGLGVGLALAERVARAHGGRILASSRPGRGSTFTLSIPMIPCERGVVVTPWREQETARSA